MISDLTINNFGPIRSLDWSRIGNINLIIGSNGSGKTFLLKALYCAVRSSEIHKRGDEPRDFADILGDKLIWTFQVNETRDLISAQERKLKFSMHLDDLRVSFFVDDTTKRQDVSARISGEKRSSNSIFLPAKEVLSLFGIITKTREQDRLFGFDDTYLDLVKALQIPTGRGKNYLEFSQSRKELESMLGGKVKFENKSSKWVFVQNKHTFPMGVTSEGIKKISILDTLLGNRFLDTKSIIFIDEPESALHPKALVKFLDIVGALAKRGIQFFIASHSYFVIKKLYLIAQEQAMSIPVQSIDDDGTWKLDDLLEGMPENPIISESVRLYDQEVGLVLG